MTAERQSDYQVLLAYAAEEAFLVVRIAPKAMLIVRKAPGMRRGSDSGALFPLLFRVLLSLCQVKSWFWRLFLALSCFSS